MLSGENQRAMKREHSGRPDYGQTNYERLHNNICIVFFYIPAFVYLFSLFGFSVSSRFFLLLFHPDQTYSRWFCIYIRYYS